MCKMPDPPGFLAVHYGAQTPVVAIAGHLVYGAILGAAYRPKTPVLSLRSRRHGLSCSRGRPDVMPARPLGA